MQWVSKHIQVLGLIRTLYWNHWMSLEIRQRHSLLCVVCVNIKQLDKKGNSYKLHLVVTIIEA